MKRPAIIVYQPHPGRAIGPCQHFARPDHIQFFIRLRLVNAQGDTLNRPAAIQPQNQSGTIARSAPNLCFQTESAVIAVQPGNFTVHKMKGRIPHQGPIGEDPDIGPRRARRHGRNPRCAAFLIT